MVRHFTRATTHDGYGNDNLWLAPENKSWSGWDRGYSKDKYFKIFGSCNSIVYALCSVGPTTLQYFTLQGNIKTRRMGIFFFLNLYFESFIILLTFTLIYIT